MKKIVVIGGGASGIVAAIRAKKANNEVIVLERNSKCLKKLLITGNGRCNYYNDNQDLVHYHSSNEELIEDIITKRNLEILKNFFERIGIIPSVKEGYYYPYSNQAISIENSLLLTAKEKGVKIITDCLVEDIFKEKNKFLIKTDKDIYEFDKVIISVGGCSAPKTGSDGNFYHIIEKFNHTIIKPLPALVQLNTSGNFLNNWSGIRVNANIKLYEDDKYIKEENGELLLTNYGVSGICIMQLSGLVSRGLYMNKKEEIVINFLKDFARTRDDFIKFMDNRYLLLPNRNITELLDTVLNYKLINVLVKQASISNTKKWDQLSPKEKNILAKMFVEFRLNIISTNSFERAQTTTGGVSLAEINLNTMESLIVKNLYFTGEVIDIDGDCGGYNLTLSFISGILAGDDASD